MKTFLEYVAEDIIRKYGNNLAHTAIIFPNKRARLFFNEYLARQVEGPMWSPAYVTISELFRKHSTLTVADPIKLVCDLHKSFVEVTGINESLDHFYSWGQIMLTDFDDIDKNLADASQIFKNLGDLHELDDLSYLSPEQIEMLKRFFSNFDESKSTELKRRFITLWSKFNEIYIRFNQRLESKGLTYEGALYRKVALDDSLSFDYDRYIFIGFNLLQRVEQRLFSRLREAGKGFFYWDFDHYYMPRKSAICSNEAGHYIASYLSDFPNELDISRDEVYRNFERPKKISYVTAPTENIQAVYASQWLLEGNRIADGRKTAVVMCNEGQLQAIVHNIPSKADKINITTGYPLAQSPFCSLISALISLRNDGYIPKRERYRLRYVNAILKHPYMRYISPLHVELFNDINVAARQFFIPVGTLSKDEGLSLLFGQLDDNGTTFPEKTLRWIMALLKHIATNAKATTDQFFKESLFNVFTIINRLYDLVATGDLAVDIITLQRLLRQILQSSSIPFHGEPAVGIQFMGVLETRNLDFEHLLILSCNEGNMPKGVNDTSFIPYSIRKAHGLTTIDNKVAIYAYYFYRLLQRATDVTIVYNNSTDGTSTGEMSRFMLQIMLESGHSIDKCSIVSGMKAISRKPLPVTKTPEVMRILLKRFDKGLRGFGKKPLLTPTSITKYMRCQLRYYYSYILGLTDVQEKEEETIDNIQFGNIFHKASQKVYERMMSEYGTVVQKQHIEKFYKADAYLTGVVEETLDEEIYNIGTNSNIKPEYNGLQLINIKVITTYLKQLLTIDMQLAPFKIIALEQDVTEDIEVEIGTTGHILHSTIGGFIDRLDQVTDSTGRQCVRVVDYKTGGGRFANDIDDVETIFTDKWKASHGDYYLQTIIYSNIVRHSSQFNPQSLPVSPALLFIQHSQKASPTLCINKKPIADIIEIEDEFRSRLLKLLSDIFNPSLPFTPTEDLRTCESCPFLKLCR
ncbi:MAG: PD-(D/E)XK nuclease family protein [Prevotella sp.]